MDAPTIAVILFLLVLFGFLAFYTSRMIFRKVLKDASNERINKLSRISAIILSPILLIGVVTLLIYVMILMTPELSPEEEAIQYYETIEEDIQEDLKVGMSKIDVLEMLGDNDTTQSVMVYDLSLPEEKGKYLLEIHFDNGRLSSFQRKE